MDNWIERIELIFFQAPLRGDFHIVSHAFQFDSKPMEWTFACKLRPPLWCPILPKFCSHLFCWPPISRSNRRNTCFPLISIFLCNTNDPFNIESYAHLLTVIATTVLISSPNNLILSRFVAKKINPIHFSFNPLNLTTALSLSSSQLCQFHFPSHQQLWLHPTANNCSTSSHLFRLTSISSHPTLLYTQNTHHQAFTQQNQHLTLA